MSSHFEFLTPASFQVLPFIFLIWFHFWDFNKHLIGTCLDGLQRRKAVRYETELELIIEVRCGPVHQVV